MRRRGWLLNALLFVMGWSVSGGAKAQGISDTQQLAETQQPEAVAEAGATYTVVRGDTLWDISKAHLGDPLRWPALWEANRAIIENPNLIYPGQQLVFPEGAIVPTSADGTTAAAGTGMPGAVPRNPLMARSFRPPEPEKSPDYQRGGYAFEDLFDPNAPRPVAGETIMSTAGFISPSDYQGPRIAAAELPHPDIGERDVVYLDIGAANGVTAGSVWEILRQRRPVFEPGSFERVGVLIQQVGRLQVLCVQQDSAIAIITKAFTYIEEGDFVIPFAPREAPMTTGSPDTDFCEPARGDVSGRIIDAQKGGFRTSDAVSVMSGDVVYVDIGRRNNVVPGQYYVVFQPSRLGNELPPIQIGELVILTAEQETATAMVTKIRQEVEVGDRIVLK